MDQVEVEVVKLGHFVLIDLIGFDSILELTLLWLLRLVYHLTKQHSRHLKCHLQVEGFVSLGIIVMSCKVSLQV